MRVLSIVALLLSALTGCVRIPEGVPTVRGFELERYLGRWYEIARLDHPFERGLTRVSADYSLRQDGGIRVVNRAYDPRAENWREAVGRAYFVRDDSRGLLKVSFFGPFYGTYNIIALDREGYGWALVCGPSRDYLWILSRTPELSPALREELTGIARQLGFPVEGLISVAHDR